MSNLDYKSLYFELLNEVKRYNNGRTRHDGALKILREYEASRPLGGQIRPPLFINTNREAQWKKDGELRRKVGADEYERLKRQGW